jgi:NADH:ubiquinone oxidoreductase subunit 4 (subunit M)
MKCESELNISALMTEVIFMVKCCKRNTTRKRPDRAIANFLSMEVFRIPVFDAIDLFFFREDKCMIQMFKAKR